MKIMVVGSNPSNRSPDNSAFSVHTQSGKIIREWFSDIEGVYFFNVLDEPTPNNRHLKISEIRAALPNLRMQLLDADRIVAVGNTAAIACERLGLTYFKMWHPSRRCRKKNDPVLLRDQVKKMRDWIAKD
jgi:uracil-DNA glycosylase